MSDSLAPLSMGLTRQAYWSRSALPSPGDLPDPGMELRPVTFMRPKINQPTSWEKKKTHTETTSPKSLVRVEAAKKLPNLFSQSA